MERGEDWVFVDIGLSSSPRLAVFPLFCLPGKRDFSSPSSLFSLCMVVCGFPFFGSNANVRQKRETPTRKRILLILCLVLLLGTGGKEERELCICEKIHAAGWIEANTTTTDLCSSIQDEYVGLQLATEGT